MLTSTGSSGLYKAPVSKGLLLVPSALSVLLVLLFHHYLSFFQYNVLEVKEDFQIWRIVLGRIICLDLKDTLCSSMLIYNFRIFERRYGSRKFTSFLLGTWILSALLECVLVEALRHAFGVAVNRLPSGFLAPIFALFVPFYCSIPGVQVTVVFGHFPVSNKTLVYIVGLQLLTSSPSMSIIASSGLERSKRITEIRVYESSRAAELEYRDPTKNRKDRLSWILDIRSVKRAAKEEEGTQRGSDL